MVLFCLCRSCFVLVIYLWGVDYVYVKFIVNSRVLYFIFFCVCVTIRICFSYECVD